MPRKPKLAVVGELSVCLGYLQPIVSHGHLHLFALPPLRLSGIDQEFTMIAGRVDGARNPSGPDPRETQPSPKTPVIYVPNSLKLMQFH
jgi:hypothetical protein